MPIPCDPSDQGMATPEFGSGVSDNEDLDEFPSDMKSLYTNSSDSDSFSMMQSLGGLVQKFKNSQFQETEPSLSSEPDRTPDPSYQNDSDALMRHRRKSFLNKLVSTSSINSLLQPPFSKSGTRLPSVRSSDSEDDMSPRSAPSNEDHAKQHRLGTISTLDSPAEAKQSLDHNEALARSRLAMGSSNSKSFEEKRNSFIETIRSAKNALKPQGSFFRKPGSKPGGQHDKEEQEDPPCEIPGGSGGPEPASDPSPPASTLAEDSKYSVISSQTAEKPAPVTPPVSQSSARLSEPPPSFPSLTLEKLPSASAMAAKRLNLVKISDGSSSFDKTSLRLHKDTGEDATKDSPYQHSPTISTKDSLTSTPSPSPFLRDKSGSGKAVSREKQALSSGRLAALGLASDARSGSAKFAQPGPATAKAGGKTVGLAISSSRGDELAAPQNEGATKAMVKRRQTLSGAYAKPSPQLLADHVLSKTLFESQRKTPESVRVDVSPAKSGTAAGKPTSGESSSEAGSDGAKANIAVTQPTKSAAKKHVVLTDSATEKQPSKVSAQNAALAESTPSLVCRKTKTKPSVRSDAPNGVNKLIHNIIQPLPERVLFAQATLLPAETAALNTMRQIVASDLVPDPTLLKLLWYHQNETFSEAVSHRIELDDWVTTHHAEAARVYKQNVATGMVYSYGCSLWGHPVIVCRVREFIKVHPNQHILLTIHLLDIVRTCLLNPGVVEQVVFVVDMEDAILYQQSLVVFLRGISRLYCGLVAAWLFVNCDVASYIAVTDHEIFEDCLRQKFHYVTKTSIRDFVCLDQLETRYGGFAQDAVRFDCLYTSKDDLSKGKFRTISPIGPTIPSDPLLPIAASLSSPPLRLSDLRSVHASILATVQALFNAHVYDSIFPLYVTLRSVFSVSTVSTKQDSPTSSIPSPQLPCQQLRLLPTELVAFSKLKLLLFDPSSVIYIPAVTQHLSSLPPSQMDQLLLRVLYSTRMNIFHVAKNLVDLIDFEDKARAVSPIPSACRAVYVLCQTLWKQPLILFQAREYFSLIDDVGSSALTAQTAVCAALTHIVAQNFQVGTIEQWMLLVNLEGTSPHVYSEESSRLDDILNCIETKFPSHTACLLLRYNDCQYVPPPRFELQTISLHNDADLESWAAITPSIESHLKYGSALKTKEDLRAKASGRALFEATAVADVQNVWYHVPFPYREAPIKYTQHVARTTSLCVTNKAANQPRSPVGAALHLHCMLSPRAFSDMYNCIYFESVPLCVHPMLLARSLTSGIGPSTLVRSPFADSLLSSSSPMGSSSTLTHHQLNAIRLSPNESTFEGGSGTQINSNLPFYSSMTNQYQRFPSHPESAATSDYCAMSSFDQDSRVVLMRQTRKPGGLASPVLDSTPPGVDTSDKGGGTQPQVKIMDTSHVTVARSQGSSGSRDGLFGSPTSTTTRPVPLLVSPPNAHLGSNSRAHLSIGSPSGSTSSMDVGRADRLRVSPKTQTRTVKTTVITSTFAKYPTSSALGAVQPAKTVSPGTLAPQDLGGFASKEAATRLVVRGPKPKAAAVQQQQPSDPAPRKDVDKAQAAAKNKEAMGRILGMLKISLPKQYHQSLTEEVVKPFLEVNCGNIPKAVKAISEHLIWREQNVVSMNKNELRAGIADYKICYVHGHDRQLRPILISRLDSIRYSDTAVIRKYILYTIDTLIQEMYHHFRSQTITVIVDAKNFTAFGLLSMAMSSLLTCLLSNFPRRLHRCFVISASDAFKDFYEKVISSHLPPLTRSKVKLLDADFTTTLKKSIHDSQLEHWLGGTMAEYKYSPGQLPPILYNRT